MESADMILLEKSLTVLGDGVLEGREPFGESRLELAAALAHAVDHVLAALEHHALESLEPLR